MSFRTFSIGRRGSDSQGSRNALNQFNGVVTNQAIAGKVVELASSLKVHQREQDGKRQTLEASAGSTGHEHSGMENHWTRHYDEAHSCFYLHNERTGETRWEDTSDAAGSTLVETSTFQSAVTHSIASERKRFLRYETDEGDNYYVPEVGGEAVWRLPETAG